MKYKEIDKDLLADLTRRIHDSLHPDLTKICGNQRPQNKGMLGGPKDMCTMPKNHQGICFQKQQWSPDC